MPGKGLLLKKKRAPGYDDAGHEFREYMKYKKTQSKEVGKLMESIKKAGTEKGLTKVELDDLIKGKRGSKLMKFIGKVGKKFLPGAMIAANVLDYLESKKEK